MSSQDQDQPLPSPQSPSAGDFQLTFSNSGSEASRPSSPARQDAEKDLRKCWICFADEDEDTPETSRWRSPCPCALEAHEACLLDWVADMENGNSKKTPPELLCPQCKSRIHLARPWDPVVELIKAGERVFARLLIPGAACVVSASVAHLFAWHGAYTIYQIFDQHDAWAILSPYLGPGAHGEDLVARLDHWRNHWRLSLGLPMISPLLVLSRTSLADSILPIMPIVFFVSQGNMEQSATMWPPSASMTFAVLPYIRGLYNAYYSRVWAHHMRRWKKQVRPRNGETQDDGNGDDEAGDAREDLGMFEIRVEGNLWEEWHDNERPARAGPQQQQQRAQVAQREQQEAEHAAQDLVHAMERPPAHPLNAPPEDEDGAPAPAPDVPRQPPVAAARPDHAGEPPARIAFSPLGLTGGIVGALLFPTLASLSGELLRLCLPASWVEPTRSIWGYGRTSPSGLLQKKWGRSVVGGCLFVVIKDAVVLYVRWRMAQQHGRRRILNYDKKRGRVTV